MNKFTVAIVGRPNVGKSTLFNRLVGKKHAIVDDFPGVTRDWREGNANIGPLHFKVIDTAGLEEDAKDEMSQKIKQVTINALDNAQVILFVADGKSGVTNDDMLFARWLRKNPKKTILLVNKSESSSAAIYIQDFYRLGMGEPVFISAEHGLGMIDLYTEISREYDEYIKTKADLERANADLGIANVSLHNAIAAMQALCGNTPSDSNWLAGSKPILQALIATDNWLPASHAQSHPQFYQQYALHVDATQRFSISSFVWGPGQGTPVHNHTIAGWVGVLRGAELCR